MTEWDPALDALIDLYRLSTSERGKRYMRGWNESYPAADGSGETVAIDALAGASVRFLDRQVMVIAHNADPLWISPEMQMLWESSLDSFPVESAALHPEDLIAPVGFAYFSEPVRLPGSTQASPVYQAALRKRGIARPDTAPEGIALRGILWAEGIITPEWMDEAIRDAEQDEPSMPAAPIDRSGATVYAFHRVGDADGFDARFREVAPHFMVGDLILEGVLPIRFGVPVQDVVAGRMGQADSRDATNLASVFVSMMKMASQVIERGSERERGSKPARKRLRREGLPERSILVVRLRRASRPLPDDHVPKPVDWSHRWPVRAHWRKQPYPSRGTVEPKFIAAYVKGPPDKPLVVKRRTVFDWDR